MDKQKLRGAREWIQSELKKSVDFWLKNGMDEVNGGVYTCLDRRGEIYSTDKSVWMQGRCGWIFAYLCHVYGAREEWLRASKSCLDFMEAHCINRAAGDRMYFTVTAEGAPLRQRRYCFSEAFYAMANAEYYGVTGEREHLERARRAYDLYWNLNHGMPDPTGLGPKTEPETRTGRAFGIPMMKKTGYKPEFAGAVEAAASTGGQIMPPIMGAAAFLMAEYMNVTYGEVALRAILPAVLYFTGIFIAVHLEAKKLRLSGIPKEELPVMSKLIRKIYLLLPLVVLVWLVTTNTRTMQFSATVAILVAIVVSLFDKDNRITPAKIFEALEAGGKGTITVAVACCMAGIIAGCITATGLASKLISAVVSISNQVSFVNPQFIAMFLTMICCIILGMGVPTTANYCIMASTCAPILITMGVPKICAHFFVFYFGIVADITPPVALAAYAGSAIAKSNPMKTGINATKLAIGAFIVPYIFCLNPAMLLIDVTAFGIIQIVITSLVGIFGVAAAMNGFLFKKLEWPCRVLICIGGLLMMDPTAITDVIGIVLFAAVFAWQYFGAKKERAAACKY